MLFLPQTRIHIAQLRDMEGILCALKRGIFPKNPLLSGQGL